MRGLLRGFCRAEPGETLELSIEDRRYVYLDHFCAGSEQHRLLGIGLSDAGHTAALYARLPHGWRTTPAGLPTDVYMWQQVLSLPDLRAARTARPSVVTLADPPRRDLYATAGVSQFGEPRVCGNRVVVAARNGGLYVFDLAAVRGR